MPKLFFKKNKCFPCLSYLLFASSTAFWNYSPGSKKDIENCRNSLKQEHPVESFLSEINHHLIEIADFFISGYLSRQNHISSNN
jgi:hypothetical protein